MTAPPLRKNRDFVLLQTAELLSSGGSQITAIAYPLLVLAVTGSPAQAGLVAFARMAPMVVLALPAGLAADRWRRKTLMLGADAVSAVAASIVPAALAVPSTDSIGHGYRVAMTPDRLLGRVEAVWTTVALTIAPLGPLAAGLLLTDSPRAAIGLFVVFSLALALYGTLNPAIRAAPRLSELDGHSALAGAEAEQAGLGR